MNTIKIDPNDGVIKRIRDIPLNQPFVARTHTGGELRLFVCLENRIIQMSDFTGVAYKNDAGTMYDYQEVDLEIKVC